MSRNNYFYMSKTAFILISIALLLFMLFVPNYIAPQTDGAEGKWEWTDMSVRAIVFATIILPTFFIIIYSDNLDFNVAPTYIPMIEGQNLWGTVAYIALCVASVFFQTTKPNPTEMPLESNLVSFSVVATVLLAIRSVVLDGPWGMHLNRDFEHRFTKFFRVIVILLFVATVAISFALPLLGITMPAITELNNVFPNILFAVTEEFTATFTMLIVAGALALVVATFALNQVVGIFGGLTQAVRDVARGDFGGGSSYSRKVDCYDCEKFYINNDGKPCCSATGRLHSTTQNNCPFYKER